MKALNFIVYALIRLMWALTGLIPMGFTFWWLRGVSRVAYRLASGRRRLMLWNLEQALGDQTTEAERERIARESFTNLFISMGELMHMRQIMDKWPEHFRIEGGEIIDRLIEDKQGFFVFGGHFGGWGMPAMFPLRFSKLPGFNMVARPIRNPYVQNLFEYIAGKYGRLISTRGTGDIIEERIARGEMVGFYMDQESRRDQGIFVQFFGREASSHVVPGYLAWKNQIPLIPYWLRRERPGYFHVVFREPLRFELTEDKDENNRRVTQLIVSEIERTIKEYPEQWLWAHNRWRRRPDGTKLELFEKGKRRSRSKKRRSGDYLSSEDLAGKAGPGE